jgi:hypothetical protein
MIGDIVGDDARHEALKILIPTVLLGVQRPVSLYHPAEVAGRERTEHERRRPAGGRGQDLLDGAHRAEQATQIGLTHAGEEAGDLPGGPGVQVTECFPACVAERDDLPAGVGGGPLPGDQAVGLEPAQNAAEVARVEVESPAQVDHVGGAGLGELEQDPGLSQRVRRVEQAASQHPDDVGVEAIEGADRGHGLGNGHSLTIAKVSLTKSRKSFQYEQ